LNSLRVLGGLQLRGPCGPVVGRVAQRRPLALLAVLAMADDRGCTRDQLAGLLWGDTDDSHALHEVSNTLYVIHRDLGADAVISEATQLRLNAAVVDSDIHAFDTALERQDRAAAAAAYGGALLEGFHLHGAPAFEEWLSDHRQRLAARYADALEGLAKEAEEARDHAAAASWWQKLAAHDPYNSRVAAGLAFALAAVHDRANGLQHLRAHIRLLREEIGLEPETEVLAAEQILLVPRKTTDTGPKLQALLATNLSEPTLESALAHPETIGSGTPTGAWANRLHAGLQRATRRRWVIAAICAVVALAAYAEMHARHLPAAAPRRSLLALPVSQPAVDAPGLTFAVSPDGNTFVYVGQSATSQELFTRGMESMEATPIPGTQGASAAFYSPDGQWVGFVAGGRIRKIPVRGGPAETVCDAPGVVLGASWGEDGIVFTPSTSAGLMRVPAAGGTPVALTTPDTAHAETSHRWPEVLPGGTGVLFTSWSGRLRSARAAVLDLRTGVIHRLGTGIGVRYSSTGHIVFATADGRLLARRFDRQTLQASDPTIEVLKGVRLDAGPAFTVGPGGTIIYMPAQTAERTVEWIDRAGRTAVVLGSRRVYSDPRLSPDGSRLALTIREEGAADVWVYSFAAGTLSRLTRGAESLYPVWSPDGRVIAFASSRRGALELYQVPADGSAEPTLLHAGPGDDVPESWSPDGKTLFFRSTHSATGRDVWVLHMTGMTGGRGEVELLLGTDADERSAMISPDGRRLAYTSDESGAAQVYVRAYRGPTAKWQVSVDGGTEPLWSRDGRELFYRQRDAVIAAAVETSGGFHVTSRTVLFTDRLMANPFRTNYDVARDGRRFIGIRPGVAAAQLVTLMNWLPSAER
jgi:Tol biopolymer transport system component/DNA-binding SARP family transcriptional activator